MLEVVCWINPEDYWIINSLNENNVPIQSYGYKFEIRGGVDQTNQESGVSLFIQELRNAHITIGVSTPIDYKIDGEFKLGFICQENVTNRLPFACSMSDEVKKTVYSGNDIEKLEYIGYTLERFYQEKGATFYLFDVREKIEKMKESA